jgi:acyl-coenzyme A synthetase/AMP-(fatty) acid ligase
MISIGASYFECMLASLPTVREACVIPSTQTDACYQYRAFVVLTQSAPSAVYEFQTEYCTILEGMSVKVEILPELPKTPMGRVSRERLLALCTESAA